MPNTQRVSNIQSNNSALNSDYDISMLWKRLLGNKGGVLFSDDTKKEFSFDILTGILSAGEDVDIANAIILCTRPTSNPIPNQKFLAQFQFTGSVTLDKTNGNKIYIEILENLILDPSLIEDPAGQSDYAKGFNIGEIKSTADYPTHTNYIKLFEIDGVGELVDVREGLTIPYADEIQSNLNDLSDRVENLEEKDDDLQEQINDINTYGIASPSLQNQDYPLGEDVSPQDLIDGKVSLFPEGPVTFAESSEIHNVGDVSANTRVSRKCFGSGIPGTFMKMALAKVDTLGADLNIRIETDANGSPSGSLIDSNAVATVLRSGLTTSLVDTTIPLTSGSTSNAHGVTLNSTELSQTRYKGVKITLTSQIGVLTVVKNASCTATTAYLYDVNGNLVTSAAFSSNTATLNYDNVLNGATYYLLVGSGGSAYTSVKQTGSTAYPYIQSKLNYVSGGFLTLQASDSQSLPTTGLTSPVPTNHEVHFTVNAKVKMISGGSTLWQGGTLLETAVGGYYSGNTILQPGITYTYKRSDNNFYTQNGGALAFPYVKTNVTFTGTDGRCQDIGVTTAGVMNEDEDTHNIANITTNDNITIPFGTPVHVVVSQVGDAVDSGRYFKVGFMTKNTTTRPMKLFDGSSYGSADNTKFLYVSSDIFQTILLSKTDATYGYKLPDIARIATEAKTEGNLIKYDFQGISKVINGLTIGDGVYVTNTPGLLGNTPGTYFCKIGTVNMSDEILIGPGLTPSYISSGLPSGTFNIYIPVGIVKKIHIGFKLTSDMRNNDTYYKYTQFSFCGIFEKRGNQVRYTKMYGGYSGNLNGGIPSDVTNAQSGDMSLYTTNAIPTPAQIATGTSTRGDGAILRVNSFSWCGGAIIMNVTTTAGSVLYVSPGIPD